MYNDRECNWENNRDLLIFCGYQRPPFKSAILGWSFKKWLLRTLTFLVKEAHMASHRPYLYLVLDASFPSICNSYSEQHQSVSPGTEGEHCAQHRDGNCNCGSALWLLCRTGPQDCGGEKKDRAPIKKLHLYQE